MFLNSMEGVTQDDPLAMVAYGTALLPLIRELQSSFPMVRQSWYADDAGAGEKFAELKKLFNEVQIKGPRFGYYPEPSKSIIIVKETDVSLATDFFSDLQFKAMTGSRYLGRFIGDVLGGNHWLSKKTESWWEVIDKLSQSAKNYPQSSYTALQKSLQCEWSFIHRVVSGVENQFQSVQNAIEKKFLPEIFNESLEDEDPRISLTSLPLKFAGLGIPNVVRSASQSFNFSFMEAKYLVSSLNKGVKFLHADHFRVVREAKEVNRATSLKANNDFFDSISLSMGPNEKRTILRGKSTGQWLSVYPSVKNGTDL